MESLKQEIRPYITIKEAQEKVLNRSDQWYRQRIDRGKIRASKGGKGAEYIIETQSLFNYLESLQY